jgi:hypothetical protein
MSGDDAEWGRYGGNTDVRLQPKTNNISADNPLGSSRLPKIGIVVTIFLNIIAVEFGYLNFLAVPAVRNKVWRTSLSAHQSLPVPALALEQGSFFFNRAILASDEAYLEEVARNITSPEVSPSNQRAFRNYTTFASPNIPGVDDDGVIHTVFFDGSYPQLTAVDDVFLLFQFYCKCVNQRMEQHL